MRASPSSRNGWRSRVIVHGAAAVALVLAACSPDSIVPAMEEDGPLLPPTSFAIGTDPVTGAWVETDKDDYAPGETVQITAAGWAADEVVTIHLTREPMTSEDDTWTVTAGADGTFETSYLVKESDLWVEFTMTASGPQSGSVVEVFFTDGLPQSVSGSPSSVTVEPGEAAEYTITVQMGGNDNACTVTLEVISGLPAGATAAFAGNPVAATNEDFSRTLTVTTTTSTPEGTYNLEVRATRGTNCQGAAPSPIGSVTLVVEAAPPSNQPPVLTPIGDKVVDEETELAFMAEASDEDVASLLFTLAAPAGGEYPTGATIDAVTGAFSWTPSEAQGPGIFRVKVVVTDNGGLQDEEEIEITVNEVNRAPILDPIGDATIDEEVLFTFTATASDPDIPANTLTFSLVGEPAGAAITPGGDFSWTPTEAQGPGEYTFTVRVDDDGTPSLSDEEEITITVNEVNRAPELDPIGDQAVDEGSELSFTATATDPDIPANTLTFSLGAGAPAGAAIDPTTGVFTWTPVDGPGDGQQISVIVTDDGVPAMADTVTLTVTVNNVAPTIQTLSPEPFSVHAITGPVTVTATYTDPGAEDTHTCLASAIATGVDPVTGTGGSAAAGAGTCSSPLSFTEAGVYAVTMTVTDKDGGFDTAETTVVVFDPSAGFVTGGGWIHSPAGAYTADPSLEGRANFGFVSRYQRGATVPTGNTEFVFQAGGLNFHSSSYQWLVVNQNGENAQFKGTGRINGQGNYDFMIWATDGGTGSGAGPDTFRIQIMDGSIVVYDNGVSQAIAGGSIVIHTGGNGGSKK
jgi:uncharacterized cupredoxin-like copper-binding protein